MGLVLLAGAPKTPGEHLTNGYVMNLLLDYPVAAVLVLLLHITFSTCIVKYPRGVAGFPPRARTVLSH